MRRPSRPGPGLLPSLALTFAFALALGASGARVNACPLLSGAAEVDLAGGHDDNLMLSIAPDASGTLLRHGGAYGAVAPLVAVACSGGGFGLRLSGAGDYRGAGDVGALHTHSLELRGWFPRLGPVRLHLAGSAGAFLASRFPEDEFLFVGGEAGVSAAVTDQLSLLLSARADRRTMRAEPAADALQGQRDWLLAPAMRLGWQPWSALELAAAASLLEVRDADQGGSTFRRWQTGLELTAFWRRLTFAGAGWGGRLHQAETSETHLGGRLEVRLDLGRNAELHAGAELAEPVSSGASRDYARRLFTLGIALRASYQRQRPEPAELAPDLRPRIEGDRVRFRLRVKNAGRVSVVGSWDDWATPGKALLPTDQPELWELSTPLPVGAHRYHFLVDGKPQRPPDAGRYVADDFGSEDGVVEIGAGAGPPASASNGGGG